MGLALELDGSEGGGAGGGGRAALSHGATDCLGTLPGRGSYPTGSSRDSKSNQSKAKKAQDSVFEEGADLENAIAISWPLGLYFYIHLKFVKLFRLFKMSHFYKHLDYMPGVS